MRTWLLGCVAVMMAVGAPRAQTALPEAWHGNWEGTCTLEPPYQGESEFKASLFVQPQAGRANYTWRITYTHAGRGAEARDYELVPQSDPGHYVVDEKNGLLLDTYLNGGMIYSAYHIGVMLYEITYELRSDRIIMSGPSYVNDPVARTTCLTSRPDFCTRSIKLAMVQRCELMKRQMGIRPPG